MRKAIATVALSGTLPEKLEAIARAGFAAVEIFADDLEAFPGSAREVRRLTDALDLEVVLLQPLRNYVGAPAKHRAEANESARRLLENMNQLGCRLLLACSATEAVTSPEPAAQIEDLRRLAALADHAGRSMEPTPPLFPRQRHAGGGGICRSGAAGRVSGRLVAGYFQRSLPVVSTGVGGRGRFCVFTVVAAAGRGPGLTRCPRLSPLLVKLFLWVIPFETGNTTPQRRTAEQRIKISRGRRRRQAPVRPASSLTHLANILVRRGKRTFFASRTGGNPANYSV